MVCTADDLLGWKDFPKGLRVLLLDEDSDSATGIKSRLEKMDYIVFTFCNENEALTAILNGIECFHVAIVEVSTSNSNGSFRFLESAKDLPTIMTSNIHCLSTMMKCIALGAAEFLQKPLSEDKLKNIWQHVVHKAFNAGGTGVSKSLKPTKDTIISRLQLQAETMNPKNENLLEAEGEVQPHKHDHDQSADSDRFPAPSTPQLKRGGRLLDDGDCQDQPNCSMEKDPGDQESDLKSVDITCSNLAEETTSKVDPVPMAQVAGIKEEDDSPDGSQNESNISSLRNDEDRVADSRVKNGSPKKKSIPPFCGHRVDKKKTKVDWTPELHKQFVQAVEKLGVDQAIPSRILDLMKVEGLTRHNVASHLQKYRMHRRHIVPKEDDWRWHHSTDTLQRVYAQKPVMAFPPYHSNYGLSANQIYPVWGHPPSIQMRGGHPGFPSWRLPQSWPWKTYPGMYADAWGCPVMPTPQVPSCSPSPQYPPGFHSSDTGQELGKLQRVLFELNPAEEEVIDRVVKEAISKPWLPLPLGLKPPSTESVLSELHGQGISTIPLRPHSNQSQKVSYVSIFSEELQKQHKRGISLLLFSI
ncbi:two-component response regulator-like APRR2 isoform X2 [Telopea speciosissima]|uniref:two-component response regulator-like APRR2 isoform X2 n=1 Tax=Telopea speciosissima TaxID=54955 RepID=UPI001CC33BDE|nr:two-component response regulator-like APRR2 isoform X2 [Telopea speciosissima]